MGELYKTHSSPELLLMCVKNRVLGFVQSTSGVVCMILTNDCRIEYKKLELNQREYL